MMMLAAGMLDFTAPGQGNYFATNLAKQESLLIKFRITIKEDYTY